MDFLEVIGHVNEYALLKSEDGEFFIIEADEDQTPINTVLEKTEDCINLANVLIWLGFAEDEK